MARRRRQLSDQLRDLIENGAHSRYRISKETGLDKGALSHFMAGHRGMSMDSIDKLGEFLDLVIVPRAELKRGGSR